MRFILAIILAISLAGCTVISEQARDIAGIDTEAPARIEIGKRWVFGVVVFGVGVGVFIPDAAIGAAMAEGAATK